MTRSLLQLLVALVLTFGSSLSWADDNTLKTMGDRMTAVETAAAAANASAMETAFNAGDNCWVLVSSALVLLMTLPGLALFYGGMVRTKNVVSTLMQQITSYGGSFTSLGNLAVKTIGSWDKGAAALNAAFQQGPRAVYAVVYQQAIASGSTPAEATTLAAQAAKRARHLAILLVPVWLVTAALVAIAIALVFGR